MSVSFQDAGAQLPRSTISGRLDMEGTDSVSARLMELVEQPRSGGVVDLSAGRFLASVGIRALVSSARAVQQRGGKMVVVVSPGSTVATSLEATGVDTLIPVFTNSTQAQVAALK